jgi:hypothetical protein
MGLLARVEMAVEAQRVVVAVVAAITAVVVAAMARAAAVDLPISQG